MLEERAKAINGGPVHGLRRMVALSVRRESIALSTMVGLTPTPKAKPKGNVKSKAMPKVKKAPLQKQKPDLVELDSTSESEEVVKLGKVEEGREEEGRHSSSSTSHVTDLAKKMAAAIVEEKEEAKKAEEQAEARKARERRTASRAWNLTWRAIADANRSRGRLPVTRGSAARAGRGSGRGSHTS